MYCKIENIRGFGISLLQDKEEEVIEEKEQRTGRKLIRLSLMPHEQIVGGSEIKMSTAFVLYQPQQMLK
jgi:hypothetical protein